MPFLALIISGAIPDSSKGKVTEIMPAVISAIKSAPGVKNVYAGAVVAENHAAATQTKICHIIGTPLFIHPHRSSSRYQSVHVANV